MIAAPPRVNCVRNRREATPTSATDTSQSTIRNSNRKRRRKRARVCVVDPGIEYRILSLPFSMPDPSF
jgi:hypothetical protein